LKIAHSTQLCPGTLVENHWSIAGVLNLLSLAYPQIESELLLHTPKTTFNHICVPFVGLLDMNFISAYPLQTPRIPLGVPLPQVENCWSIGTHIKQYITKNCNILHYRVSSTILDKYEGRSVDLTGTCLNCG
jgi:hypothetical protein